MMARSQPKDKTVVINLILTFIFTGKPVSGMHKHRQTLRTQIIQFEMTNLLKMEACDATAA